jgi:hypothetical protein
MTRTTCSVRFSPAAREANEARFVRRGALVFALDARLGIAMSGIEGRGAILLRLMRDAQRPASLRPIRRTATIRFVSIEWPGA